MGEGVKVGASVAAGARSVRDPARDRARDRARGTPRAAAAGRAPGEADHLEALADEITTLAAHIHAATHRLLTLLAEFDQLRGWEGEGHRSCAHWLAFRTGIDLGAAREKVRVARALEALPETSAAMARGALSFAKVRALTRVAMPESEGDLLELAHGSTAAELERMVRGWRLMGRKDEAERERIRHATRTLSVFPGDDGMYVVRGRLDPEVGALLMRAVEAAADVLYGRERVGGAGVSGRDGDPIAGPERAPTVGLPPEAPGEPTPEQRRADALGLLAERALAVGFGGGAGPDAGGASDGLPVSLPAPLSGSRAERYQVVLHVEAATLRAGGDPGRSELEDGTRVSAETSRRIACDASVVEVGHAADGRVLDVGRRTRTIPPALRRALEVRDRGCRFPGCGSRFTDAHHIVHWADGGATRLDNLVLLCRHHHRLLHEGGFRLELNPWPGGRPVFYDPRGIPVPEAPPPRTLPSGDASGVAGAPPGATPGAPGAGAAEALLRANRSRGIDPSWDTASCRWARADEVPLDVLSQAEEAA